MRTPFIDAHSCSHQPIYHVACQASGFLPYHSVISVVVNIKKLPRLCGGFPATCPEATNRPNPQACPSRSRCDGRRCGSLRAHARIASRTTRQTRSSASLKTSSTPFRGENRRGEGATPRFVFLFAFVENMDTMLPTLQPAFVARVHLR